MYGEAASALRKIVFGPTTLTTGCSPIVLVTTPPHPASKARRMLLSDSVGGAEERRNGFSNWIPVKVTDLAGIGSTPSAPGFHGSPAGAGRRRGCEEAVGGGIGATGLRR